MHQAYVTEFIESAGFGVRRALRFHLPENLPVTIADERVIVRGAELVGWLCNPSPKVYLTASGVPLKHLLTNRMVRAKIPTRDLTDVELKALAELKAGKDLIVQRSTPVPTVVGALRAQQQCLDCHDVSVGDLLGAFTYRLQPTTNHIEKIHVTAKDVALGNNPHETISADTKNLSSAISCSIRPVNVNDQD